MFTLFWKHTEHALEPSQEPISRYFESLKFLIRLFIITLNFLPDNPFIFFTSSLKFDFPEIALVKEFSITLKKVSFLSPEKLIVVSSIEKT